MQKERISALKVLLKYDRADTEAMVEEMYENSEGIAKVQISELLLRMLKAEDEKDIFFDVNLTDE